MTSALLCNPVAVAINSWGDVAIADFSYNVVRKVIEASSFTTNDSFDIFATSFSTSSPLISMFAFADQFHWNHQHDRRGQLSTTILG